jgi:hypothetical protein
MNGEMSDKRNLKSSCFQTGWFELRDLDDDYASFIRNSGTAVSSSEFRGFALFSPAVKRATIESPK